MIIKGGSVCGGGLAPHLQKEENEVIQIIAAEGMLSLDVNGLMAEIRARAAGITRKGTIHIAVSAQPGQKWGTEEKQQAIDAVLKEYRAEGVPFFVVRHRKDAQGVGRDDHLHIIISRINARGRVVEDGYTRVRNEKVARALEFDLGHPLTIGKHNMAVMNRLAKDGRHEIVAWMRAGAADIALRPTADLTHAEAQQQARTKLTKAEAGAAALAAWQVSDCGAALRAALAAAGYQLAKGRQGGVMVVDPAAGSHDITRLIRAAMKAEGDKRPAANVRALIEAKLSDIDRAALPALADAVAAVRDGIVSTSSASDGEAIGARRADQVEPIVAAGILTKLTTESATFTEAEIDRALRGGAEKEYRPALKAEILASADVLTVALDGDGQRRLTTRDMAEIEAGILDRAEAMSASRRFAVNAVAIQRGIDTFIANIKARKGHDLDPEQIGGIRHATGGVDFVRITGVAGAGKSTLMEGAARIWTSAGYRVDGMALSGVAAARLAEAGIASDTIHASLLAWDRAESLAELRKTGRFTADTRAIVLRSLDWMRAEAMRRGDSTASIDDRHHQVDHAGRIDQLDRRTRRWLTGWLERQTAKDIDARTVLVVDEAGMVNHRLFNRILAHAHRVGAKVVAVGDPEQIQPIEAGAAFRLLEKIAPAWRLSEVRRQREGWQREATKAFASGDTAAAGKAVLAYDERGFITAGIRGAGTPATMYAEAEEKLGRSLDDEDRRHIDQLVDYMGARVEAGALWREIMSDRGTDIEDHPLYDEFRAAQDHRAAAVQAIAADIEAASPWLARYGVNPEGFAADHGVAEGLSRDEAQEAAADRAEALGIAAIEADMKLSFDWRDQARQALFADWHRDLAADGMPVSRIILAYTRADAARLNDDARAAMRAEGHLSGDDIAIRTEIDGEAGTMAVAVGDRIMTLANNRTIGVQNGTIGRVIEIGRNDAGATELTIATDDGRTVAIDTGQYRALQAGYACTLHKAQGVTVDRTWLLNHSLIDRHLAYVGMSRHRLSVKIYSAAIDARTVAGLARQFAHARTKDAISDYVDVRRLVRAPAAASAATWRAKPSAMAQFTSTIINTTKGIIHGAFTRARAIGDRFGMPVALRQLDAHPDAARSTAAAADRLRDMPRLAVARDADRSSVLLPRDAVDQLGQHESRGADDLRRAELRGSRLENTPALPPEHHAHKGATTTNGDPTMTEHMYSIGDSIRQLVRDTVFTPGPEITDRELLAEARHLEALDDPKYFEQALADYQTALVLGADGEELRRRKAEVMARGEAVLAATNGRHETAALWATEANAAENAAETE